MVAILEKSEHNINFHLIVDFVEASPLRYALTFKPTVYVSHIREFWSTARIETTEEGTKILATVDDILRTVSESSLSRNLKLKDEEGISSLPDAEPFENLTLMGYNISPNQKFTFQKGQFSHQWKYLIHTIMQCISPKSAGFNEFSSNIATALVCLATNRVYNFSKMIFDGMVKNVNNKVSKFLMYLRRTRTAQSSALPPVADEPASPLRDVSQGEACPTDYGFEADQDRAKIAKTATLPYDSAPRVTSPATDEGKDKDRRGAKRSGDDAPIKGRRLDVGEEAAERVSDDTEEMKTVLTSMDAATVSGSIPTAGPPAAEVPTGSDIDAQVTRELEEQMAREDQIMSEQIARDAEIARIHAKEELQIMIDGLDRNRRGAKRSGDDAPIKGRRLDVGEEAAERVSDDTEEMKTVLTSMDAATVLSGGVSELPTSSGSIPTAGPPAAEVPTGSDVIPTAGPIFATATVVTPYTRRKGKETMVESGTLKKKKIARDTEIARIHAKEELQIMIDGLDRSNETIAKYQDKYAKVHKFHTQQRNPWSKKQKRDYYMVVIKSNLGWKVKDFRGMTFEEIEAKFTTVWKQIEDFIPIGSKEEAEIFKRKGIRFEQESVKKLKTSEEVPEDVKTSDKVPEEKVKEMMQLVPIEEVYVEALQVKHLIIDRKVHTKGQRNYWKITRLGGSSASYQFFVDLLKHLDMEDLNQLWALVKESLSIKPPTSDKEMKLWVELKRLYEPNNEDQLWTHT
nr:synaptobrevin, longin-like domain protein [Tanacetum cinerariifolium]